MAGFSGLCIDVIACRLALRRHKGSQIELLIFVIWKEAHRGATEGIRPQACLTHRGGLNIFGNSGNIKSLTISSGKLFDRYRKRSRSQPRVDTRSHGYNVGLRLLPQLHISLSLPSSLIFILWFGAPAIAASNRRRGQTVECIASGWMFVASVSNDISLQCVFSSPSQVAKYSIGISGPKVTEIKSIIVGCGWKNDTRYS